MINSEYLKTHNFLIITLDSLRYDVSRAANIPNLKKWFKKYGTHDDFVLTYAPATYTLPSHTSMFVAGIFPENRDMGGYYNRYSQSMIRTRSVEAKGKRAGINFNSSSIIKGFAENGYRTIGIGGVGWFNKDTYTAKILADMFSEFYYDSKFHECNPRSLEDQIKQFKEVFDPQQKTVLFLNVSSTHYPYCNFSDTFEGQKKSLEYVDKHIGEVLKMMKADRELFCIICGDHGDLFGFNGRGHGFYHIKVMEVPMMVLDTSDVVKIDNDTGMEIDSKNEVEAIDSEVLKEKDYLIQEQKYHINQLTENKTRILGEINKIKTENTRVVGNNRKLLEEINKLKKIKKISLREKIRVAVVSRPKLYNFISRLSNFVKKK